MHIAFLREKFRAAAAASAIVWRDREVTYAWLLDEIGRMEGLLAARNVPRGAVVSIEADFSPRAVALLLALIDHDAVIVPLTSSVKDKKAEFCEIAEVETQISIDDADVIDVRETGTTASHPLVRTLKDAQHPGLVLFSSGSTGKSKAALHDIVPMLEKFKVPRQTMRTLTFLLFDHYMEIGRASCRERV